MLQMIAKIYILAYEYPWIFYMKRIKKSKTYKKGKYLFGVALNS